MPCAYPSACNSLSHLLHLTVLPPTQHSACGSSFWSKISPLGSHSNLCIYLYYHLSRFVVHVKSHTLDCELFRCRNCVLIPLGPPYSPFYPWCRHLLNPRWIQPFRAPDLYCLHPQLERAKGSGSNECLAALGGGPAPALISCRGHSQLGRVTPDSDRFSLACP